MFEITPEARFTPCVQCGFWIPYGDEDEHVCDAEDVLSFQLFLLRDEIAAFEMQLIAWLDSPQGRFATWIAERDRLGAETPS